MYWIESPNTCRNFYELCRKGYYNGTIFHRIIPGFIIQGGDPSGTGRGGNSIYEEPFDDEISELKHTGAGILSMANSGLNTNTSQFMITLAPLPSLNGKHTIFGRVSDGMQVIQRMSHVATDSNHQPSEKISILRAYCCE